MALQPFNGQLDPAPSAPALQPFTGELDAEKGQGGGVAENIGVGLLRGAKDVVDTGAQLLASGFDKIAGTKEGDRVAAMNTEGKAEFDKAYGGSTAAEVGRVGGQIAATLPVGGALGAGVRAAGVAGLAPRAAIPLGEAIASGGLRAGEAGLVTRAAGGAIAGGAAAGLADPEQAVTGVAVGAALPAVVRVGGQAFNRLGLAVRGPDVPEGVRQAAEAGAAAGYVVPPSQVRPSLLNRILEGSAGKISTAQNASARNQEVTNRLARAAVEAEEGEALSPSLLNTIRQRAGRAYEAVRELGEIAPDAEYLKSLNHIAATSKGASRSFPGFADDTVGQLIDGLRVPTMHSSSAVDAIRVLRDRADAAYRAGSKAEGKATKAAADTIESLLDRSFAASGAPAGAIKAFRDARQTIAKTYSLERAMNPTTGTVSAQKLAQQLARGKPLSGELRQAAEFGAAFPKAAQTVEAMGSLPQTSPLDWAAAGGLSALTGSPLGAAALLSRPAARKAALSGPIQRAMLKAPQPAGATTGLLEMTDSTAAQRLAGGLPVALSSRDH